jgi:hypothetical protein
VEHKQRAEAELIEELARHPIASKAAQLSGSGSDPGGGLLSIVVTRIASARGSSSGATAGSGS